MDMSRTPHFQGICLNKSIFYQIQTDIYIIYMYNINILYIYIINKYIYIIYNIIYFYVNIYTLTSQRNCCALFTYKISHSHANIGTNSPAWTIASTRFFRWRGVEFHWGSIAYPCSPIPLYPLYPPMIHILLNHGVWGMGLPQLYSVVLACSCYVSRFLSSFIYLNIPQLSSWFSRVLCPTRFLKLWISASNHCGRCLHVCFFGWRWSERLGAQGRTAWPGLRKRLPGSRFPSGEHLATGVVILWCWRWVHFGEDCMSTCRLPSDFVNR